MATSRVRRPTDASPEYDAFERGYRVGVAVKHGAYMLWGAVAGFLAGLALAAYLDLFRVLAGCLGAGR
jgi:hypothetical protein